MKKIELIKAANDKSLLITDKEAVLFFDKVVDVLTYPNINVRDS